MLGIQPFKNFYKWGCLFLGIPVDVFRQDGLMVQMRAHPDSDDEGEDAYLTLIKTTKNFRGGCLCKLRGCYLFKYT